MLHSALTSSEWGSLRNEFGLFLYLARVLPRNQIHWDKWPSDIEKGGPFQKIWDPSELPIYDANGLSAFRQVEKT